MNGVIHPVSLLSALTDWMRPVYEYDEARSISIMIMEKKLGLTLKNIAFNAEYELSDNLIFDLNGLLKRILKHEPVQYVLGEAYFYDRWFMVNKSVLIPRPETEELCRLIIKENPEKNFKVLDIGTGSGCIAIILASYLDCLQVHGWDISSEALQVAQKNAEKFGTDISFRKCNILVPTGDTGRFDIIVCNPPYVTQAESSGMRENVLDFEPHEALFVNSDPLEFHKAVLEKKENLLVPGGKFYFEINETSGESIKELMKTHLLKNIKVHKDIHGKNRFASAKM